MPEPLTQADVRRIAQLCKLELSDEQAETYRAQLGAILDYMEQLHSLDLDGVEPMTHVGDAYNRLRDDVPGPTFPPETVAALAPRSSGPFIEVPKVLGDGGGA